MKIISHDVSTNVWKMGMKCILIFCRFCSLCGFVFYTPKQFSCSSFVVLLSTALLLEIYVLLVPLFMLCRQVKQRQRNRPLQLAKTSIPSYPTNSRQWMTSHQPVQRKMVRSGNILLFVLLIIWPGLPIASSTLQIFKRVLTVL